MRATFGIDLGTTNSSVARLVDGRPVAIPVDGSTLVPSVVLYRDGKAIVGREARNLELEYPGATIRSVKRRMGQDHRYDLPHGSVAPAEVSAEILRALARGAESATGLPARDTVITVPAYFDDAQRRATLQAGELAGLNVLRLLNEPTSASLVYDQVGSERADGASEIVMVYDLGGGTFDVSILEVAGDVREVRATTGNTHLGGDDFDEALVRLFVDELKRRHGADPTADPRAMVRLRRIAEETKIQLSNDTSAGINAEFITTDDRNRPVHLEMTVTRRDFEARIAPLMQSTVDLARRALDDARLVGQSLSRICLVGGSTRIPICRSLLSAAFGVDIHEEVDPDLAVSLGAAIQAGLLAGEPVERILVDVTSHGLGIRVLGEDDSEYEEPDTFASVLTRNTVLPASRTEEFYIILDQQEKLHVEVFQGESRRVSENTPVGSFHFDLVPKPVHSPIRVEFAYDLNGVVKVTVSQPGTENAKTVALAVADAGARSQTAPSKEASAVERKARALLDGLDGKARSTLTALLDGYVKAAGPARAEAEERLLDFFIDHEDRDASGPDFEREPDAESGGA